MLGAFLKLNFIYWKFWEGFGIFAKGSLLKTLNVYLIRKTKDKLSNDTVDTRVVEMLPYRERSPVAAHGAWRRWTLWQIDCEWKKSAKVILHKVKESGCTYLPTQIRMMTGALQTLFQNKTYKVFQAYSRVESSQLPMIDWIWLFVHICMWLYRLCSIVLLHPLISYSFLEPSISYRYIDWIHL